MFVDIPHTHTHTHAHTHAHAHTRSLSRLVGHCLCLQSATGAIDVRNVDVTTIVIPNDDQKFTFCVKRTDKSTVYAGKELFRQNLVLVLLCGHSAAN